MQESYREKKGLWLIEGGATVNVHFSITIEVQVSVILGLHNHFFSLLIVI